LRDAFSDLRFELKETVADGELVMAAAVMTGRHTGPFNGIAPTGRPISHNQVHIFTIPNGQITRHRAVRDDLGLLFQLGAKLASNARDAAATSSSSQEGAGSSFA
jgi:predicted ester cyclase